MRPVIKRFFLCIACFTILSLISGCSMNITARGDIGYGVRSLFAGWIRLPSSIIIWEHQGPPGHKSSWKKVNKIYDGAEKYLYGGNFHFSINPNPWGTGETIRSIDVYWDGKCIKRIKPNLMTSISNGKDNAGHDCKIQIIYERRSQYTDLEGREHNDMVISRIEDVIIRVWTCIK